jgi:hypothetical protein
VRLPGEASDDGRLMEVHAERLDGDQLVASTVR